MTHWLPAAVASRTPPDICQGHVEISACRIGPAEFAHATKDWERRLERRGHQLGRHFIETDLAKLNAEPRAWYYDSERVFLQAANHFADSAGTWNTYAQAAEAAYKAYLRPGFTVPGYERFPHGLALDYRRNGDEDSLATLRALRDRGPFADVLTNSNARHWYRQAYSREIAYMIETHVMAERSGLDRRPAALERYVDMALQHIRAWTTGQYRTEDPQWRFCQAFMAGLTASALIDYHELTVDNKDADKRIPRAVRALADRLIDHMWVVNHATDTVTTRLPRLYGSFRYAVPAVPDVGGDSPAPDLNLLIAPMYAWLYLETGKQHYRTVGDMAFVAGVALASIDRPKVFNQNYRNSFSYLSWRASGNERWSE